MHIPLVDLRAQHEQVADEIAEGFRRVLDETSFILGGDVAQFEAEFAAFSGVDHCIGVGNGTDALELALRALDVGAGDEVILPTNSFIATAMAVVRAGATVVLVDSDPRYHLIDVDQAAARIGPKTKAVIPVHLFGQVAPMEGLGEATESRGIPLVEDAAQSQGARRNRQAAGGLGAIAGTSFYPGKNLGAYGDGGAVTTNDAGLAGRVRHLRNYGSEVKYHHPEEGFNSRLDTLQAVVLRVKLRRLAEWNEQRRQAARRYDELLGHRDDVVLPSTLDGNEHIFHLYVVEVDDRDDVLGRLQQAGVGAGVHYPVPIHLQGAFAALGHGPGAFPVAEAAAGRILSLPLFPGITADQQARVVEELEKALSA
jgi:dTDP-4-amino-4,6-dideoxygalactose transaminase